MRFSKVKVAQVIPQKAFLFVRVLHVSSTFDFPRFDYFFSPPDWSDFCD